MPGEIALSIGGTILESNDMRSRQRHLCSLARSRLFQKRLGRMGGIRPESLKLTSALKEAVPRSAMDPQLACSC